MTAAVRVPKPIGFTDLRKWLRHRHPMIMIDRIVDHEPGEFLHALVCVSGTSDWATGHFPERSIYPGTHLLQSFAQCGIILYQMSTSMLEEDELTLITSANARFFKAVVPGDRLLYETKVDRLEGNRFHFSGNVRVESARVAAFRSMLVRAKIDSLGSPLW